MFDTGQPTSRDELVASLTRLTREGAEALSAMPVDRFFAAQGEHWSPSDHARHLQLAAAAFITGLRLPVWILRLRFGRPQRPSRSFNALRTDYRAALANGGRAGRFTPLPEAPPTNPDRRRGQILTEWFLTTWRVGQLLTRWREDRLDTAQLPHPLMGMLTVREMAAFTVYHTAHHLSIVMQRATHGA